MEWPRIEQGVSFVEVTLGSVGNNIFGWDTHQNNFTQVKTLSAELDAGWGTLMTLVPTIVEIASSLSPNDVAITCNCVST